MSKDKQRVIGDLETLVNHVLEKARARAEAVLARARKEAAEIEKRAAEEAKAREEAIVNAGLKDVEKEKRRILAQAELELRGQLLETEHALLRELEAELRSQLLALRENDPALYKRILTAMVRAALADTGEPSRVVIQLSPADQETLGDWVKQLASQAGAQEVEVKASDLAAGIVVEIPDQGLQFDLSLGEIMREFQPRLANLLQEALLSPRGQKTGGEANGT